MINAHTFKKKKKTQTKPNAVSHQKVKLYQMKLKCFVKMEKILPARTILYVFKLTKSIPFCVFVCLFSVAKLFFMLALLNSFKNGKLFSLFHIKLFQKYNILTF